MLPETLLQRVPIRLFSAMHYSLLFGILVKTVNLLKDFNMKKSTLYSKIGYFILFSISFFGNKLCAQVQFIQSGKIVFEKKTNQHAPLLDEPDNVWNAERIKAFPKFVSDTYEIKFNNNKSIYKLAKDNPNNRYMIWGGKPVDTDATMQDLKQGTSVTQKEVV